MLISLLSFVWVDIVSVFLFVGPVEAAKKCFCTIHWHWRCSNCNNCLPITIPPPPPPPPNIHTHQSLYRWYSPRVLIELYDRLSDCPSSSTFAQQHFWLYRSNKVSAYAVRQISWTYTAGHGSEYFVWANWIWKFGWIDVFLDYVCETFGAFVGW